MIERLLKVEHTDEPTEIVIHVNMLKEGWDVTNLYTIVPLRAANARILIEQSIGRGLRLPYGKRTGVTAVDRLNIVAHDRFQEIIDEANKPDSAIRLQAVVLDPDELGQKTVTVVSQSQLADQAGLAAGTGHGSTTVAGRTNQPCSRKPEEQKVAQIAYEVIRKLENQPESVPSVSICRSRKIQAAIVKEVDRTVSAGADGAGRHRRATPISRRSWRRRPSWSSQQTIDIPRILVVPKGEVKSGFKPFTLNLDALKLSSRRRRNSGFSICARTRPSRGARPRRHRGGAAGRLRRQRPGRLRRRVLRRPRRPALRSGRAGRRAFQELSVRRRRAQSAALLPARHRPLHPCPDAGPLLGRGGRLRSEGQQGFHRAEAERLHGRRRASRRSISGTRLPTRATWRNTCSVASSAASIRCRSSTPTRSASSPSFSNASRSSGSSRPRGSSRSTTSRDADHLEYQPDFVAETADGIYMLEPKGAERDGDPDVLAKRDAAVAWCEHASTTRATTAASPGATRSSRMTSSRRT